MSTDTAAAAYISAQENTSESTEPAESELVEPMGSDLDCAHGLEDIRNQQNGRPPLKVNINLGKGAPSTSSSAPSPTISSAKDKGLLVAAIAKEKEDVGLKKAKGKGAGKSGIQKAEEPSSLSGSLTASSCEGQGPAEKIQASNKWQKLTHKAALKGPSKTQSATKPKAKCAQD